MFGACLMCQKVESRNSEGGVLARNGKIYGIPRSQGSKLLIIVPQTGTVDISNPGDPKNWTNLWSQGVLAGNGKIYCFQWVHGAPEMGVIDPDTNSVTTLKLPGSAQCSTGAVGPNGTNTYYLFACLLLPLLLLY